MAEFHSFDSIEVAEKKVEESPANKCVRESERMLLVLFVNDEKRIQFVRFGIMSTH